MVNYQNSYYSVSYGATALKICYDTEHQKVGEYISQKFTLQSLLALSLVTNYFNVSRVYVYLF